MHAAAVNRILAGVPGGPWTLQPLGASAFCTTWRASGAAGALFVKSTPAAAPRAQGATAGSPAGDSGPHGITLLAAEADGLQALAATHTIRVPELALLHEDAAGSVLAMEWLDLAPADPGFGRRFGAALARLHAAPCALQPPGFGWRCDNYLGATPQVNTPVDASWPDFFARCRLAAMRERLSRRATGELRRAIDDVIDALPQLVPGAVAPSLIHGDLWQGNWGMLADGTPVIFDPAVSCSHAQAELAMLALFGGLPDGFMAAYESSGGVRAEPRRLRLYQLYHLLNHEVLFGGYAAQALQCAREVLR